VSLLTGGCTGASYRPVDQSPGRRRASPGAHYDQRFVEWSEPDDGAWEDPFDPHSEGSSAARDPEYPSAPLPAHERRWRHPSELGHAEWVQSERTAGLGRGLLITSGAIGCILGLAVVWLMVPGPGGPPSAGPSVARSDLVVATTAGFGAVATTLAVTAGVATSAPGRTSTVPTVDVRSTTTVASTIAAPVEMPSQTIAPQLPAEDLPSNTVWVRSDADGAEPAVAVVVGDSPYMVTTAMAVGDMATVRLVRSTGGLSEVPVLAVDAGFAYLWRDESLLRSGFASSALAAQGDNLTVLADDQVTFRLGDDTLAGLDPASVAEGTPVVNEAGALVGLCTRGNGVVELVQIDTTRPAAPDVSEPSQPSQPRSETTVAPQPSSPDPSPAASTTLTVATSSPALASSSTPTTTSTSTASPPTSTSTTVGTTTTVAVTRVTPWIGVRLAGAGGAIPLAITSVTAGSPAAAAGLAVGDVLRAIEGVTVTSVDDVLRRIGSRAPGDTIVVSVAGPAGAAVGRDVRVVLGEQTL
jgi:hypothetical protein